MPPTVLVVDDDPDSRHVLVDLLLGLGYHVLAPASGAGALALAHRLEPDVILCDVAMPGLAGFALLDWFAAQRPSVPVILMGAVVPEGPGRVRYLRKPIDLADVMAAVAEAVGADPLLDA